MNKTVLICLPPLADPAMVVFWCGLARAAVAKGAPVAIAAPARYHLEVLNGFDGRVRPGSVALVDAADRAAVEDPAKNGVTFVFVDASVAAPPFDHAVRVWIAMHPTPVGALAARERMRDAARTGVHRERRAAVVFWSGMEGVLSDDVLRRGLDDEKRVWITGDGRLFSGAEQDECWFERLWANRRLRKTYERMLDDIESCPDAGSPAGALHDRLGEVEERIKRRVWSRLSAGQWNADAIERLIAAETGSALEAAGVRLTSADAASLRTRVRDDAFGLGPLAPLLRDPSVSEILVNGDRTAFIERDGRLEPLPALFRDHRHLSVVIERLVKRAGRRVDHARPFCDVRLEDGSRANIALPPVSLGGPAVSIRRFKEDVLSSADLSRLGSATAAQLACLERLVLEKANVIVAGNTGAGKTTLLNILSTWIPPDERIITLEDTAELKLPQSHVVRFETRPPNAEGAGEVTMRDLVVNALRMRPDRLIVGECRGDEVIPMLQALNTGHKGSMSTVHANGAADALVRLESMVLLGAPQWSAEAVRRQIASAIDALVFIRRSGGRRRIEEIGRVAAQSGVLTVVPMDGEATL